MDERLVELEVRVAHYEQSLEELSDVIARQQGEIHRLESRVEKILEHLRTQTERDAPG